MSQKYFVQLLKIVVAVALLTLATGVALVLISSGLDAIWNKNWSAAGVGAFADLLEALVLIVSVGLAFLAYRNSQRVAAKDKTVDLIFEEHTDHDVLRTRRVYAALKNTEAIQPSILFHADHRGKSDFKAIRDALADAKALSRLKAALGDDFRDETDESIDRVIVRVKNAIVAVMNRYEAFAVAIDAGAVDEAMYQKWWKAQLLSDYRYLQSVIAEIKSRRPKAFENFTKLARRWDAEEDAA